MVSNEWWQVVCASGGGGLVLPGLLGALRQRVELDSVFDVPRRSTDVTKASATTAEDVDNL